MADAVTTQVLINGSRLLVLKITNISDGTGETSVVKVDASAYDCSEFRIRGIDYNIQGQDVQLYWDATAPVLIGSFSGIGKANMFGTAGFANNAEDGKTGDILLTTEKATDGDSYTITLDMVKVD